MTDDAAAAIMVPRISIESRSAVLVCSIAAKKIAVAERYHETSTQVIGLVSLLTCTTAREKPVL